MTSILRTSSLWIPLALSGLVACSGGETQKPVRPLIVAFTASPVDVPAGGTTMLRWDVTGAQKIQIDVSGGDNVLPSTSKAQGSVVSPTLSAATTFVLTAQNGGGTATASVSVTVGGGGGPAIVAFTATPNMLAQAGTTTLSWQTTGGTSLKIEAGGAAVYTADAGMVNQGTTAVTVPATTVYTLVVANAQGQEARQSETVTVGGQTGPTITAFTATPDTINMGDSSTLAWTIENATSITVRDMAGATVYTGSDLNGMQVVRPTQTDTYTIAALDANNAAATAMVTVTVNANPNGAIINSFTAMPSAIVDGASSTLSWDVSNAPDGIDIMESGNVLTSAMMATGSFMVTPMATSDYTLIAKNTTDGNAMQTITVTVNPPGTPMVATFDAAPNPIAEGAATTVSWTTTGADRVRILEGATQAYETTTDVATGNTALTPTAAETTYTIEASLAGGTPATAQVTVYAHAAPVVTTFTVTPNTLTAAGPVTVAWDVANVASLTLTQDGQTVGNFPAVSTTTAAVSSMGSIQVQVTQTTTFQLTATSVAGTLMPTQMVTLNVNQNTETEPNNDIANANVAIAGLTTGAIPPGDVDYFAVTVVAGGSIRAETSDGIGGCGFDTVIDVYSPGGVLVATNDDGGTTPCSLIDPTVDAGASDLVAGTYYVVVRGFNATATGAYTLDIQVNPPLCGNNITESNANEQCDDNNTTANDGCSATCQFEVNATQVNAPGATVVVNFAATTDLHLIRINVPTSGMAIAVTAADPGGTTCNNVDTFLNLANDQFQVIGQKADGGPTGTAGDCAAVLYPADAFATNLEAGTYYLAVLGTAGTGSVEVQVTISNAVCGNGAFEAFVEECDDGNTTANDGCSATCTLEIAQTVTLPIATPVVAAGALLAGEFDTYQLTITAETFIRAETFAPNVAGGCPNADTFLIVRNSNQEVIGIDDEGGTGSCSRVDETQSGMRLAPGTYYVQVFEFFNAALPAYEIRFESVPVNAMSPAFDAEPNDTQAAAQVSGLTAAGTVTVQGRITPDGDDDVWSFTVPANQALTLTARTHGVLATPTVCTPQNPVVDTRIFVERAGSETAGPGTFELAFNDDVDVNNNQWCSAVTNVATPGGTAGATYHVRVQGFGDTGFRAYFLTLTLQ